VGFTLRGVTAAVFVLIWVVCAGFAALLAARKNRSAGWFAVAGLLLGPIGVLWAAFARDPVAEDERRREEISETLREHRRVHGR